MVLNSSQQNIQYCTLLKKHNFIENAIIMTTTKEKVEKYKEVVVNDVEQVDSKDLPSKTLKKEEQEKQQHECPKEEFTALLVQASSLSIEEAGEELIECARHGDIDAVLAILDTFQHQTIKNKNNDVMMNNDNNDEKKTTTVTTEEEDTILFINCKDDNGNTALHKACANGHINVTKLLVERKSNHVSNTSGNTPLHWAAANGHIGCVETILLNAEYDDIDVLQKNGFGRSALTEGFSSEVTEVVGLLLEHDSAEEERLLGGDIVKEEVDDDDVIVEEGEKEQSGNVNTTTPSKKKKEVAGVVHEFDFRSTASSLSISESNTETSFESNSNTLLVRELPIKHADNPFGDEPSEDTTGLGIWCASIIMSRWIADDSSDNDSKKCFKERLNDKVILELGAGCGVPALTAALYCNPKTVYISDLNPETVENIQHNIKLNQSKLASSTSTTINTSNIHGVSIDWQDASTYPNEKLDYVLGSDLIYQETTISILKDILYKLLKPNGSFLYVAPKDYLRHGLSDFIKLLQLPVCSSSKEEDDTANPKDNHYFELSSQEDAPEEYKTNPLVSKDDDDCFLHFHELASMNYVLYEFILREV